MKVQTRLCILCSIIFGVIFAISSVLIYNSYRKYVELTTYSDLERIANICALFYLDKDELPSEDYNKIKTQYEDIFSSSQFSCQVYNIDGKMIYGKKQYVVPEEILTKIRENRIMSFASEIHFCFGIYMKDNSGDYMVVAMKKLSDVKERLKILSQVLVFAFMIGIISIVFLSKKIAEIAYKPFSKIISQVKNISTNNLEVKIELPDTKDELQNLIETFNMLLSKISETVIVQKNFVNYVSHEFKSPLSAILGNLEVFLIKDRAPGEYRQLAEKLILQIHQVEEILDTLIIVSDLRNDMEVKTLSRIDELIWEIVEKIRMHHPDAKIFVHVDVPPENIDLLSVVKARTPLLIALFNIVENAVKYSKGSPVNIHLYKKDNLLELLVKDQGIGIPPEQLKDISKPFYRASNSGIASGRGIGLSVALRVFAKNNIKYEIISEINKGTSVILKF